MPAFDRRLYACRLMQLRQARRITSTAALVGQALLTYADRQGECWPAHATLAARVGCCVRSVQRAMDALRVAGLLAWDARRARWNRRMSNLYGLLTPDRLQEQPIRVPRQPSPVDRPRSVATQIAALGPMPDGLAAMVRARWDRLRLAL